MKISSLYDAANGREALDILLAEWIDIVFADINTSVMSGIELVDGMESTGLLASVPVVMISNEGSRQLVYVLK